MSLFSLLLATMVAASPAPPGETDSPRAELEALKDAVERTVREVQRPAGGHHGHRGQVYHLKGYGAVVVLPPRVLPRGRVSVDTPARRAFAEATRSLEQGLSGVTDPELRQRIRDSLAALRATGEQTRTEARRWRTQGEWSLLALAQPGAPRPPDAAAPPAEMALVQARAEAFRREAECAVARAQQDVRVRLRVYEDGSTTAVVDGGDGPRAPFAIEPPPPFAPMAPPAWPAPMAPPAPPAPPAPAPPAPPWELWLEREEPGDLSAGAVVAKVRSAVLRALASYRGDLGTLADSESVVVAVDFVTPGAARGAQRTLIARARLADLRAHGRGRLASGDLLRRIRIDEY